MGLNLGDIIKQVVVPAAVSYAMPAANPFLVGAATSGIGSLLGGGKPKDALEAALIGGASSGISRALLPAQNSTAGEQMLQNKNVYGPPPPPPAQPIAKTFTGEMLQSIGAAGEGEKGNLLFRLLNTQMGEGIAAGLVAQLLAGDDDEDTISEFDRREFGAGGPGGKLGGINYAQMADGGEAHFPRRNGGIDPSEGSGTKDDVPAMLMAGEFVMTRDAVKGAGNGDLRQGIQRMYDMMDNLERKA